MAHRRRYPEANTARYRRARAELLAGDPLCHWGCGRVATTADHEPPLEVVGQWHWSMVPACAKCNYGRRNGLPADASIGSASREWL